MYIGHLKSVIDSCGSCMKLLLRASQSHQRLRYLLVSNELPSNLKFSHCESKQPTRHLPAEI